MGITYDTQKSGLLESVNEESEFFVGRKEIKNEYDQQNHHTELEATELFSKFTADIIKEDVIFTR